MEDIALQKAAAETMRLEILAAQGGERRLVVLERGMSSPVCTVTVDERGLPQFQQEQGQGQEQEAAALHTAYVRARLPVVLDALHLALRGSFRYESDPDYGDPSSEYRPKYTATLQLGGQQWAQASVRVALPFLDDEDEVEWAAAQEAWLQAQSEVLLSHPVVMCMLRLLCENTAL